MLLRIPLLLVSVLLLNVAETCAALEPLEPTAVAKVKLNGVQPAALSKRPEWTSVPPFLDGASVLEPTKDAGNELAFEAISNGVVLLAASWMPNGENNSDWRKGRATTKTLLRDGWTAVSADAIRTKNKQPDLHFIFRRVVKAGESYKIHTRAVGAPVLLLPSPEQAADIVALPAIAEQQAGGFVLWKLPFLGPKNPPPPTRDYHSQPAAGSVLVGLRLTTDHGNPRFGICSIQPIYENKDGRLDGDQLGEPGATAIDIEAKPGYAVGAVVGSAGTRITALKLIFMRRTKSGVDPNDSYESRWAGARRSEAETQLGGDGKAIAGLNLKIGPAVQWMELIPLGD
ncbi:MAG TPA: hypothetical protein VGI40_13005 [Pirellulaceae bacterium]|jgi:hypothetical protein